MTGSSARSRILVVDDQATHLRALCDILGQHGFETIGFPTGEAALTHIRAGAFDVLLTDLMMPGIDGLALVEAARALDPDVACVVMTGEGSIATAVKAMKVGALDYIVKPFKAATLLPVLARAIESRRLRLHNQQLEAALHERVEQLARMNEVLDAARQEADRANQEKSTFLSNMSHELRTPLNGIIGFGQILTSNKFNSSQEERLRFAQHIVTSGRHLLSLVNEILDLAKIEAGKATLALTPVPLDEVLRESHTMVAPLAQARQVVLELPAASNMVLQADRTRLTQILVNLLSNAIKYNRHNGRVSVRCSVERSQFGPFGRVAVADSGVGLSARQLVTIFQPFDRAGRREESEGTGLGLAITKRLIEAMQGAIGVESEPGVGSTFWIDLPLRNLADADPLLPAGSVALSTEAVPHRIAP
jgi:signal transduction histidine kinase